MLTDALIEALEPCEKRYQVPDEGGLFMRVSPTGKKVFSTNLDCMGKKLAPHAANCRKLP